MKSLTAVCQTGASMPAMKPNSGRVARPPHHRGDGENAEMKMYLSKLKDLVPFMPKNRKLSKLEIIQHVIDYICDLQTELEAHPDINGFDAAAALNFMPGNGGPNSNSLLNSLITSQNIDTTNGADIIATPVEDVEMTERLTTTLATATTDIQDPQQQQQLQQPRLQSSPAAATVAKKRQPLVDRQTPNTILTTLGNSAQISLNPVASTTTTAAATSTAPTAAESIAAEATQRLQQIEQATAMQNPLETPTTEVDDLATNSSRHPEDSTC